MASVSNLQMRDINEIRDELNGLKNQLNLVMEMMEQQKSISSRPPEVITLSDSEDENEMVRRKEKPEEPRKSQSSAPTIPSNAKPTDQQIQLNQASNVQDRVANDEIEILESNQSQVSEFTTQNELSGSTIQKESSASTTQSSTPKFSTNFKTPLKSKNDSEPTRISDPQSSTNISKSIRKSNKKSPQNKISASIRNSDSAYFITSFAQNVAEKTKRQKRTSKRAQNSNPKLSPSTSRNPQNVKEKQRRRNNHPAPSTSKQTKSLKKADLLKRAKKLGASKKVIRELEHFEVDSERADPSWPTNGSTSRCRQCQKHGNIVSAGRCKKCTSRYQYMRHFYLKLDKKTVCVECNEEKLISTKGMCRSCYLSNLAERKKSC